MLNDLRDVLAIWWRALRRVAVRSRLLRRIGVDKEQDRKRSEARARFWSEMRAGQQEAEARSRAQRPWPTAKEHGA